MAGRDPKAARRPSKTNATRAAKAEKKSRLSADDQAIWEHVTETVTPLTAARNLFTDHLSDETLIQSVNPAPDKKIRSYAVRPKPGTQPPQPRHPQADLSHDAAPGVDKRTLQRLIKGQMPIEGRLDLHGHTQEPAHRALDAFIQGAYSAGRRCVLIITGKGLRLDTGEIGVLRQSVPKWLNSPKLRSMVLAIRHATPKDGGEGALYVLLRRKR